MDSSETNSSNEKHVISTCKSDGELNVQTSPFSKRREIELQKQVMPLRHVVAVPAKPSVTSELTEDKLVSDKSIKEEEEIERQKMQVLVSSFTEDQLNRYEMYRRSAFPKASVKKLMQSITGGTSVPPNVVIAMAGIAKVFVGEIVEEACDVAEHCNDSVPIQPKHIREAYRRLKRKAMVPNTKYKRKLFRK